MADTPPADERASLLRKINTKLAWIIFFLVLITLNTCDLAEDLEDAVRRESRQAGPAAEGNT